MRSRMICVLTGAFAVLLQPHVQLLGQQWSSRGPVPRSEHTAVFDPTTKKMIVFGGIPDAYLTQSNLNDVFWLQNASAVGRSAIWQAVNPTGTRPAARGGHTAVYDPANSRMIVFGGGLGRSSPCSNDVWVLQNANGATGTPGWLKLSPSGGLPPIRNLSASVYDSSSNRMIVFAGNDCFAGSYNDVWVLSNANGLGGIPSWTQLAPTGTPPAARAATSAVYDPSSNVMTVYAGTATGSVLLGDLWTLSNANGLGGTPMWTQVSTAILPPPRSAHTAVYDSASNRMTVFGGGGSTGLLSDVWVLTDANDVSGSPAWIQLFPAGSPPPAPRAYHSAVYDPAANVMTIFAGLVDSLEIPISDMFVLQHANGL